MSRYRTTNQFCTMTEWYKCDCGVKVGVESLLLFDAMLEEEPDIVRRGSEWKIPKELQATEKQRQIIEKYAFMLAPLGIDEERTQLKSYCREAIGKIFQAIKDYKEKDISVFGNDYDERDDLDSCYQFMDFDGNA